MVPIRSHTTVWANQSIDDSWKHLLTLSSFTVSKLRDLHHHWQLEICSGNQMKFNQDSDDLQPETIWTSNRFPCRGVHCKSCQVTEDRMHNQNGKKDKLLFKCNQARNVRTDQSNSDISWLLRSFTFKHVHSFIQLIFNNMLATTLRVTSIVYLG